MTERIYSTPQDACTAAGVEFPRRGLVPGPWNVTAAFNGKTWKQGAGRVRMFADGRGGVAWNWIQDMRSLWFDDADGKLTPSDVLVRLERSAVEQRRWAEETEAEYAKGAAVAAELMRTVRPAVGVEHPYLTRKHVRPVPGLGVLDACSISDAFYRVLGERRRPYDPKTQKTMNGRVLVVPLYLDAHRTRLSSVELISEAGGKPALAGARASGAFWVPDEVALADEAPAVIGVAEGLATALSVSQVLGVPCAAARSCGNLRATALGLKKSFPESEIAVYGDDDEAGRREGRRAAVAVGGSLHFPSFDVNLQERFKARTGGEKPTDWNDYFIATEDL
ncbi:toprim domain-containing protein [Sutterella sp.]|uniref:toprim domain-containing protein n=1 Tax=Sutterella sp. TaxID=1981025 RepID=UPI003FD6D536